MIYTHCGDCGKTIAEAQKCARCRGFAAETKAVGAADEVRLTKQDMDEITRLQQLVVKLSDGLSDDGAGWSNEGIDRLRLEVANTVPKDALPDWLLPYRAQPTLEPVS